MYEFSNMATIQHLINPLIKHSNKAYYRRATDQSLWAAGKSSQQAQQGTRLSPAHVAIDPVATNPGHPVIPYDYTRHEPVMEL